MKAFLTPAVLIRTAGLPLSALDSLRAPATAALIDQILADEEWCRSKADALCEALYQAFRECPESDQAGRRTLLQVKRAIFNGRSVRELEATLPYLSSEAAESLLEWQRRMAGRPALLLQAEGTLAAEVVTGRGALQAYARDRRFQTAMSLASRSLFEKLTRYAETAIDQHHGRLRKMENRLVAYLSRMAAKTSPFSLFTAVTPGGWTERPTPRVLHLAPSAPGETLHVQVGHLPLRQLVEAIRQHPSLRRHLPLWVNPHQWIDGDKRHIYRRLESGPARPRVSHNQERLSVLPNAPALTAWAAQIQPGESYAAAVARLASKGMDPTKVAESLDQLIQKGVLLLEPPLAEQEPDLLGALIDLLSPIPEAANLLRPLRRLQDLYAHFPVAEPAERVALLASIQVTFQEAFAAVGGSAASGWLESALYEDATLKVTEATASTALARAVQEDLLLLQRFLPLFDDWPLIVRSFTRIFIEQYGVGGRCGNLLQFYDQCRRALGATFPELMRVDVDLLGALAETPYPPAELAQVRALRRRFLSELEKGMATGPPTWELPRSLLEESINQLPPSLTGSCSSFSYLAQVIEGAEPQLVLNAIYDGYGHFFARFAALAGENSVVTAVQESYRQLFPPGHAPAEILGTFSFNGCLHPPMTPYTLVYPSTWPLPNEQGAVALDQIQLIHDPDSDRLQFKHPDGTELHPLYLGLLVPHLLPPLYRFIMMFAGASKYELYRPEGESEPPDQVVALPRMTLGNLVLQRRRWLVPKPLLPVRAPGATDLAYLLAVQRWRAQHHLPDQVFIRANEHFWTGEGEPPRDMDRKPQYIDFQSPFLLDLFERHLDHVREFLLVEEMLPGPTEQSLVLANGPQVAEILLEVGHHA